MRPKLHEIMMDDLTYRIAEADKNCAMHAATAATLRSLKDLYERRAEDERRIEAAEEARREKECVAELN